MTPDDHELLTWAEEMQRQPRIDRVTIGTWAAIFAFVALEIWAIVELIF